MGKRSNNSTFCPTVLGTSRYLAMARYKHSSKRVHSPCAQATRSALPAFKQARGLANSPSTPVRMGSEHSSKHVGSPNPQASMCALKQSCASPRHPGKHVQEPKQASIQAIMCRPHALKRACARPKLLSTQANSARYMHSSKHVHSPCTQASESALRAFKLVCALTKH